MDEDVRRGRAERDATTLRSIETAIGSVEHTLQVSEWLRTVPDRQGDAEERIISGKQELALLKTRRELLASGAPHGPAEAAFTRDAVQMMQELSQEDRKRRLARERRA